MWKVRAEIKGEFVIGEKFRSFYDAIAYAEKLKEQGIWDTIEMWEI